MVCVWCLPRCRAFSAILGLTRVKSPRVSSLREGFLPSLLLPRSEITVNHEAKIIIIIIVIIGDGGIRVTDVDCGRIR